MNYVALLRGINVGGKTLKMADAKKAFEALGFRDLKTIGASGNILFSSDDRRADNLESKIKSSLNTAAIVRTVDALRALISSNPFKSVKVTDTTRLNVTFLSVPTQSKTPLALPYTSPNKIFRVLNVTPTEIITVVDLSTGGSTLDAMEFLDKQFGKGLTTRTWNTIQKLAAPQK